MSLEISVDTTKRGFFLSLIWASKQKREQFFWATLLFTLLFTIFKICYPYPDTFVDSTSYLLAAAYKLDVNIWPIGYSKFLLFFRHLTRSDLALISFQYFAMQLAALYFYFTILYFLNPRGFIKQIIFYFLFANPLTLYLSNTVASDTLFGALSLLWITQLIWISLKPKPYLILTQSLLLIICFTLRPTAYYYLPITAIAFVLSKQSLWKKTTGIALSIIFIFCFTSFSKKAVYKATGTSQSSLFTGWQLANNALFIYNHVQVDSNKLPIGDIRLVNRLAIEFYSKPRTYRDSFLSAVDGNPFIVIYFSPLKQFFLHDFKDSTYKGQIRQWARSAEVFESFGKPIIINHPLAYLRYYVLQNSKSYFFPPLSDLEKFNMGSADIDYLQKRWFRYKSDRKTCISFTAQGALIFFSALFFLLNIIYPVELIILFIKRKSVQLQKEEQNFYIIFTLYLFLNFIFIACVTKNILRYQFIPLFILLTGSLLIIDSFVKRRAKLKLT